MVLPVARAGIAGGTTRTLSRPARCKRPGPGPASCRSRAADPERLGRSIRRHWSGNPRPTMIVSKFATDLGTKSTHDHGQHRPTPPPSPAATELIVKLAARHADDTPRTTS